MARELKEIFSALKQGKELAVATVVSSSGSTPRSSGSKMVIYENGIFSGTIGGGEVEADVLRQAQEVLVTGESTLAAYNLNTQGLKDRMDIICGGTMEVLIEYVQGDAVTLNVYETACTKIDKNNPFVWEILVRTRDGRIEIERKVADYSPAGRSPSTKVLQNNGAVQFLEPVFPGHKVYICGGGHVSLELASLTSRLGWGTYVFDDREEFANHLRFPMAEGVKVCPGFDDIFSLLDIGPDSYIVIVTRGHSFDRKVLKQALETDAGYIGMIGSRKKRDSIYAQLLLEGIKKQRLQEVHCPIGLPISAETPAEIGVSIMAELLFHRAEQKPDG